MNLITIKQFAETKHITYEAVRKQLNRYRDELKDHIVTKNRTQYLDDYAVDFLSEKRRMSPVVVVTEDQREEIDALLKENEILKQKLMDAQSEIMDVQKQIIVLQEESKKMLEDQERAKFLIEENKKQAERIKQAQEVVEMTKGVISTAKIQIETLEKERDEAQAEAKSYKRSLFGFYRKVVYDT